MAEKPRAMSHLAARPRICQDERVFAGHGFHIKEGALVSGHGYLRDFTIILANCARITSSEGRNSYGRR